MDLLSLLDNILMRTEPKKKLQNMLMKHCAPDCNLAPEVIKLFSCSTQLSMKFLMLINVKMPTIVGILTFVNRKSSILGLSELKQSQIS